MQMNVIKQSIGLKEKVCDTAQEHNIDADITLPDYCPDILRVLSCTVSNQIESVKFSGGRVSAQCMAVLRLTYIGENNRINCYEQDYPFTKYEETQENENACANVKIKTNYVNCRAVSARRVDIHALLSVIFEIYKKKDEQMIADSEDCVVQLKKTDIRAFDSKMFLEKSFSMSETAQLDAQSSSVESVIHVGASALCDEIKVVNNKILVKGELIVSIIYCCEGTDGCTEKFRHSMPISQIIELEGVTEDDRCTVTLEPMSVKCLVRSDSSGENRLFDISAVVGAKIEAGNEKNICAVIDAYSTKSELKNQIKCVDFLSLEDSFSNSFLVRSQQDLSPLNFKSLETFWCSDITKECEIRDNELCVFGEITFNFIYRNKDDGIGFAQRNEEYEYRRSIKGNFDNFKCEPSVALCEESISCTSQGEADIKAEIRVSCDLFTVQSVKLISDIEESEEESENHIFGTLIIYFADEGEELWDIARHYKTSVEAIQKENSLDESRLSEKRMLLIPRAQEGKK